MRRRLIVVKDKMKRRKCVIIIKWIQISFIYIYECIVCKKENAFCSLKCEQKDTETSSVLFFLCQILSMI